MIAGQVLYFFESNVRSATIIGIVGAGGIGLHLYEAIRTLEWREVSFLVLMILAAVAVIDTVSSRLRAAMRRDGHLLSAHPSRAGSRAPATVPQCRNISSIRSA